MLHLHCARVSTARALRVEAQPGVAQRPAVTSALGAVGSASAWLDFATACGIEGPTPPRPSSPRKRHSATPRGATALPEALAMPRLCFDPEPSRVPERWPVVESIRKGRAVLSGIPRCEGAARSGPASLSITLLAGTMAAGLSAGAAGWGGRPVGLAPCRKTTSSGGRMTASGPSNEEQTHF